MKKNVAVPLFAIIVSLAIGLGSLAFSQKSNEKAKVQPDTEAVFANYYYRFTGNPGEEDNESLWELIDDEEFVESPCNQAKNGCVIKTISSTSPAPTHPALVPVTGSGSAMTPVVDNTNIAAAKFLNPL